MADAGFASDSTTAVGFSAAENNGGVENVAVGAYALRNNTEFSQNTAVGFSALSRVDTAQGDANAAFGAYSLAGLRSGSNNLAFGYGSGMLLIHGSNNIYLGSNGSYFDEDNTLRIGSNLTRTFIAGIRGATLTSDPQPVFIDSNGQLGLMSSPSRPEPLSRNATTGDQDAIVLLQQRSQTQSDQIAALEKRLRDQTIELQRLIERVATLQRQLK